MTAAPFTHAQAVRLYAEMDLELKQEFRDFPAFFAVLKWFEGVHNIGAIPAAIPSPAWCASVDAELAATAAEDARVVATVVGDEMSRAIIWSPEFAAFDLPVGTNLYAAAQSVEVRRPQHDRDSAELRRLCQERDELRRANGLCKVDIAGLETTVVHLGRLVDELRPWHDRYQYLRERRLDTIKDGGVFAGMTPDNVVLNGVDLDAAIDSAIAAANAAAANPELPPFAQELAAFGALLDGDSPEQGDAS